jgi:hypothetical protein
MADIQHMVTIALYAALTSERGLQDGGRKMLMPSRRWAASRNSEMIEDHYLYTRLNTL